MDVGVVNSQSANVPSTNDSTASFKMLTMLLQLLLTRRNPPAAHTMLPTVSPREYSATTWLIVLAVVLHAPLLSTSAEVDAVCGAHISCPAVAAHAPTKSVKNAANVEQIGVGIAK